MPSAMESLPDYKSPDIESTDPSDSWAANLKWVAANHYYAVECKEDGRISLGDVVAINADENVE